MISVAIKPVQVLTIGKIAELTGEPIHRIAYILRTRPHIRERARAGRLRIFDEQGLEQIRRELGKGGGK